MGKRLARYGGKRLRVPFDPTIAVDPGFLDCISDLICKNPRSKANADASSDSNGPLRWHPPKTTNLLMSEVSREGRRQLFTILRSANANAFFRIHCRVRWYRTRMPFSKRVRPTTASKLPSLHLHLASCWIALFTSLFLLFYMIPHLQSTV